MMASWSRMRPSKRRFALRTEGRALRAIADAVRAKGHRISQEKVAQFDTLRLRLVKIAARVVEMKTMIRVHLPTA